MRASDLQPGDVFWAGTKKAVTVERQGRRIYVSYLYSVVDDRGKVKWHRQAVLPITSYDILKELD